MQKLSTASLIFILIALGSAGYFVWPTPWKYDHVKIESNSYPVRIHRLTGKTEMLVGFDGWQLTGGAEQVTTTEKERTLPPQELKKIDGSLHRDSRDELQLELYNGTEREIQKIHIRLVAIEENGEELFNREYALTSTYGGQPLSSSMFTAACGCQLNGNQAIKSWTITKAIWK